jgi:hypothetical protein
MGQNSQQLAFAQRPCVRARALRSPDDSYGIRLTVSYALATAIIALWMAYLQLISGATLTT